MTVRTADVATLARSEAEDLLFREAAALDDNALEHWLDLFTNDAVYWVPAQPGEADPEKHVSLIYDDRGRMEERVWRLSAGPAHAQIPPSVTRRLITNVQISSAAAASVTVLSNFLILEVRKGVQRSFGGQYEHRFVRIGGDWLIKRKIVRLVNCEAPIFNLTFML